MKRDMLRWMGIAALTAMVTHPGRAGTMADIEFWVGSGTNQAAVVIDWADGLAPESLVWGYQWNGDATGLDMLLAVIRADSRLFGHLGQYTWGTAVFGLGYDRDGDGVFGVSPAPGFDADGVAWSLSPDDARAATDTDDHWREGWNSGFWAYFVSSDAGATWTSSQVGAADRVLTSGAWDGWRFAPGFSSQPPGAPLPAPVPEPAAPFLWGIGFAGWLLLRSRSRS